MSFSLSQARCRLRKLRGAPVAICRYALLALLPPSVPNTPAVTRFGFREPGLEPGSLTPSIAKPTKYSLLVNNTEEEKQKARVRSVITDHSTHTSTPMIDKKVNLLAPGEEQEFTAVNDYGAANHFNGVIGSETQNLTGREGRRRRGDREGPVQSGCVPDSERRS